MAAILILIFLIEFLGGKEEANELGQSRSESGVCFAITMQLVLALNRGSFEIPGQLLTRRRRGGSLIDDRFRTFSRGCRLRFS